MAENEVQGEWTLPDEWVWTTIGEITQPIEKVKPKENPDVSFTYLDISSIDNGINRITKPKTYYGSEAPSRARQLVEANDILFSTVRTYLRNIALVPEAYDGQIASTGFSILRAQVGISPKYLFYFSLTDRFVSELGKLQRGTSYPAVRDGDVRIQLFPIAPLPEQHRIVAEIETQFTRLDAGVAALERAQANLKRYRASVLKAACEGRLVPTEAGLHRRGAVTAPLPYEPADKLLARILAERRARWKTEHPGKKYKEPEPVDTEAPSELPESWVWTNIGSLFTVSIGGTPSRKMPEYWNGSIHWVSSGEVAFCRIKDTREKITASGLANSSAKLNPPGTVLLAMIGEGKTRGQAAILDVSAANNQNAASILCSGTSILPEWVFYWFMARYEQTRTGGVASGGMQPALNSRKVRALPIAVPPLTEQRRIVAEVERRLSVVVALEREVEAALARAARLRQSILKRAFEGRLVEQDPDDEPASVLLERIRKKIT